MQLRFPAIPGTAAVFEVQLGRVRSPPLPCILSTSIPGPRPSLMGPGMDISNHFPCKNLVKTVFHVAKQKFAMRTVLERAHQYSKPSPVHRIIKPRPLPSLAKHTFCFSVSNSLLWVDCALASLSLSTYTSS